MALTLLAFALGALALQPLPPTSAQDGTLNTSSPGLAWSDVVAGTIFLTSDIATRRDANSLTLIPPSGLEFANTFAAELTEVTGDQWTVEVVDGITDDSSGIVLTALKDDEADLSYDNGLSTEEGYVLDIGSYRVTISGAGARGMWWGTRTFMQQLMISNWTTIPAMRIVDAPAYATRGFMLDAGRKWYSPSFLKDLCTYASFFKMSEFHYHTSDNYPLSRGHNETWQNVYSHFSLRPEGDDLGGLIERWNETVSRSDFEDLQQHCAQRGVTVIPEIEAPGHCLAITKWKPELALNNTKDLLNLTHPDSIPTVKRIWTEFLPWFQTKEVHIGADEYDSDLADDYIGFVNEMARFIDTTSGKRTRIWGTYEPSSNLSISKDVIVQHWQYGQSDPVILQSQGYDVINSEDWWAYMSLKNDHTPILPAPYPQFFNESRVLNFAGEKGWQWEPSLFNPVNATERLSSQAKGNKGAIMAAWNDNGPDATTQLEAYYAIRLGIPIVAARSWSGHRGVQLDAAIDESIDFLSARVPGQNLDRRLPKPNGSSESAEDRNEIELVSWTRPTGSAGNGHETVTLGHGSAGMNFTLTLLVNGAFNLSGPDTALVLSENGSLVFTTNDGWPYPLRSVSENDALQLDPGQPGRIWSNVSSSTHEPVTIPVAVKTNITITTDVLHGSVVYVNGTLKGRFEVYVFGGKNTVFSWSQMAFVAPLETVSGGVSSLSLRGSGVKQSLGGGKGLGSGNGTSSQSGTSSGMAENGSVAGGRASSWPVWLLVFIVTSLCVRAAAIDVKRYEESKW